MLTASKDKSLINRLKFQLSNEFDKKDLGASKKTLGMEIYRVKIREALSIPEKIPRQGS